MIPPLPLNADRPTVLLPPHQVWLLGACSRLATCWVQQNRLDGPTLNLTVSITSVIQVQLVESLSSSEVQPLNRKKAGTRTPS